MREFVSYSTTTIVWQGSRFAVSMVAAKVLGPSQFGLWNALNLILSYGPSLHLGVLNGMNRDVPYFRARGLADKVEAIQRNALLFVTVVYAVAALGPGAIGALLGVRPEVLLPLALMGPVLFVHVLYSYFLVYLRSSIRFDLLSRQQVVYSVALPSLAIPLTFWFGLSGFVSGQLAAGALMCGLVAWFHGVRPVARLEWAEIRRLIAIGLPIMAVGILYEVFSTLDRWVILAVLDQERLGFYSLGIMVTGMVRLLPQVVSEQVYPRMSKRFGETGDPAALRPLVLQQTAMTFALMTAAAGGCALVLPILVRAYYPEYVPGIPAMLILVWGALAAVPRSGLGNFLNAIGRQRTALVLQVVAIALAFPLMLLLARLGYGLEGVAWGFVLGNLLYSVLVLRLGWPLLRGREE